MLLNINMVDEAVSRGIEIDTKKLSDILGIEVTKTIAPEGMGIKELIGKFPECRPVDYKITHSPALEKLLEDAKQILGNGRISSRAIALLLLHGDSDAKRYVAEQFSKEAADDITQLIDHYYEETPAHSRNVLAEFYNTLARGIIEQVQTTEALSKSSMLATFGDMCTSFSTGIPIACIVLTAMYFFIGEFGATYLVDTLNSQFFEGFLLPLVKQFTDRLSSPFLRDMIMDPDFGILPTGVFLAMGLVLPVIFCFYITFGILEDSGYLPRISILLDNIFQKMGLNGKGVIPLVMGFSCVTMALLTTRVLNTEKEKNIASFLLYLCLPCAPLIAVMLIILEKMPVSATIAVFGILISQVLIAGYLANKILPGNRSPLFLEIPPMRLPKPMAVLKMAVAKTYFFMLEALPVFVLASLGVFLFERIGGLRLLEHTMGPMIHHVMGLPEKSVQVFIKTMIRRESGATELEHLRIVYTNLQLVVNLLVMTFVAPCINSFIVLFKERGFKTGMAINITVFVYAILIGSVVNHVCQYFGITFS
jgi:ferrous iron transport protein B